MERSRAHCMGVAGTAALAAMGVALLSLPGGSVFQGVAWLWLRLPLGLLSLAFLPGYALSWLLFGASLETTDRVSFSVGLSLTQVPLLALLLNATPWGLTPAALVVSLAAVTLLWCALAYSTKRDDGAGMHRMAAHPRRRFGWLARPGAIVVAAVFVSTAVCLAAGLSQRAGALATEFWLVSAEGLAQRAGRAAATGGPITISAAIASHEVAATTFRIRVETDGVTVTESSPIRLAPGQNWQGDVTFFMPRSGADAVADISLFAGDSPRPIRSLRLVAAGAG